MCGICGKVILNSGKVPEELIRRMCASFSCRGPDDEGIFIQHLGNPEAPHISVGFGHRRLSVMDLSSAGHQPMSNENQRIRLIYNGEIYNFRQLKKYLEEKGHIFKSAADTEVILHLYEEEGISCVRRLNGMFAFALWDENRQRLWLCRDRIGIKPLVWCRNGQHFAFASEIKGLLCDPLIPKELDNEALQMYLTFSYIPAPRTIFKGIRKLEPGHSLLLEKGNIEIRKYWDIPEADSSDTVSDFSASDIKGYKSRIVSLLREAVKDRMIADVPLGAFLSGGIDSAIIVALMSDCSPKRVQTFSIGFSDGDFLDESPYARKSAEYWNTDHHEIRISSRDMLSVLPDVLETFDEPFSDSSAIPTFIISRETRRHVTVALSGDGGDELFAGYRSYLAHYWLEKYMKIPALFRRSILEKMLNSFPDARDSRFPDYIRRMKKFIRSSQGCFARRVLTLNEIAPARIRQRILDRGAFPGRNTDADTAFHWTRQQLQTFKGDPLNAVLYADMKHSLPGDMLTRVDWMSMKHSLEVRVPFLDHRVVELAFRIPGHLKLFKGRSKYILKESFRHMLPKFLYRRPKTGFEIPIGKWLRNDLAFLSDQYLSPAKIKEQGIFDEKTVRGLLRNHMNHKTDTSWILWNLIVFGYWFDRYYK